MRRTPPVKYTDGVNVFGRQMQLFAMSQRVLLPAVDDDQCPWYLPGAAQEAKYALRVRCSVASREDT